MYVIEGLVEVSSGVGGARSWSQTRSAREVCLSDRSKDIIHLYANVLRLLDATFVGERKGLVHGVKQPNLEIVTMTESPIGPEYFWLWWRPSKVKSVDERQRLRRSMMSSAVRLLASLKEALAFIVALSADKQSKIGTLRKSASAS